MDKFNIERTALVRNFILGLTLVSVAFIVHSIFGKHGYLASRQRRKELDTLQQQIQHLRRENDQLDKQNQSLKSDPTAIERPAREQLHLARPGETIFMLPEKRSPYPTTRSGEPSRPRP